MQVSSMWWEWSVWEQWLTLPLGVIWSMTHGDGHHWIAVAAAPTI